MKFLWYRQRASTVWFVIHATIGSPCFFHPPCCLPFRPFLAPAETARLVLEVASGRLHSLHHRLNRAGRHQVAAIEHAVDLAQRIL
jgi:hypothetical protein